MEQKPAGGGRGQKSERERKEKNGASRGRTQKGALGIRLTGPLPSHRAPSWLKRSRRWSLLPDTITRLETVAFLSTP